MFATALRATTALHAVSTLFIRLFVQVDVFMVPVQLQMFATALRATTALHAVSTLFVWFGNCFILSSRTLALNRLFYIDNSQEACTAQWGIRQQFGQKDEV
ncbi:unnamed protein product [Didymodactylos carnosus]|uniref:Uncharacterized protein n=1 Tax=Didymodactylos carnosus TaxID=1234261 RepID=A0A8S2QMI6_9BILA|nr:unnamed protein product [Didymodactylos carnosus]CAF4108986.1 unnamed protein product [Didymodactylos carnosus]